MYTASNIISRARLLLVWALLLAATGAAAQLSQTVTVMPPYSNRLSDYIAAPGKISSIITVTGVDWPRFEIYLRGSIISSDESVIIRANDNYKPAAPIVLAPVNTPSGLPLFSPLHADLSGYPAGFPRAAAHLPGNHTAGGAAERAAGGELHPLLRYHRL